MSTGKSGEKTDDGIVILCQSYDGLWYKVDSPRFSKDKEASKWLAEQLDQEELSPDDDYFVARCLSVAEVKLYLGVENE